MKSFRRLPCPCFLIPHCCVSSETYQYYDLPFCPPNSLDYKMEDLGEVIEGDRLVGTKYDLGFKVDKENEELCSKVLTVDEVRKFRQAVKDDYYFQVCVAAACVKDYYHFRCVWALPV